MNSLIEHADYINIRPQIFDTTPDDEAPYGIVEFKNCSQEDVNDDNPQARLKDKG